MGGFALRRAGQGPRRDTQLFRPSPGDHAIHRLANAALFLQLKGLIRLVPSLHDGRVKQLELTESGADLLARDPLAPVGAALALAEDQTRAAFADLAARCLAAMRV